MAKMTKPHDVPKMTNQQYADQIVDLMMIWGLSVKDSMTIADRMIYKIIEISDADKWKPKSPQTREMLETLAASIQKAAHGKKGH